MAYKEKRHLRFLNTTSSFLLWILTLSDVQRWLYAIQFLCVQFSCVQFLWVQFLWVQFLWVQFLWVWFLWVWFPLVLIVWLQYSFKFNSSWLKFLWTFRQILLGSIPVDPFPVDLTTYTYNAFLNASWSLWDL